MITAHPVRRLCGLIAAALLLFLYHQALAERERGDAARAAELMSRASEWNEHELDYVLVRARARQSL